jgi:hypothetical protein
LAAYDRSLKCDAKVSTNSLEKMFRSMTNVEVEILRKLLSFQTPTLFKSEALETLRVKKIDGSGSLAFASYLLGTSEPRKAHHSLASFGLVHEKDGVPVQINLFVDDALHVAELEFVRLDGAPLCGSIEPDLIERVHDIAGTQF